MSISLAQLLSGARGHLAQCGAGMLTEEQRAACMLDSVSTDSRAVQPGGVFFCIRGEHVDGHAFATQAVASGALALVAEYDPFAGASPVPVVLVPNVVQALGFLANAWRKNTQAKVVGVTGTAGKTTVKEVLAQVLGRHALTAKNHMNLNTQIGLPMSVLATSGQEAFWVMEAGISKAGDMDELGSILEPDIAVIINAGSGHTEGLGGKGVAHHKARLLAHIAPKGVSLVCADYPDLVREARMVYPSTLFFTAAGKQVAYRGSYVGPGTEGRGIYRMWLDGEQLEVEAPFVGSYGAENSIAVAAAAHVLGLGAQEIAAGLAAATLPKQRFSRRRVGAWQLVDDSYNANPLSCQRMLESAAELAAGLPFICVFGEMLELGSIAASEHEALGQRMAAAKVRHVYWKGGHGEAVARGLEKGKFSGVFKTVSSIDGVLEGLKADNIHEGVILFKGSRGNHLESMVEAFATFVEATHAV